MGQLCQDDFIEGLLKISTELSPVKACCPCGELRNHDRAKLNKPSTYNSMGPRGAMVRAWGTRRRAQWGGVPLPFSTGEFPIQITETQPCNRLTSIRNSAIVYLCRIRKDFSDHDEGERKYSRQELIRLAVFRETGSERRDTGLRHFSRNPLSPSVRMVILGKPIRNSSSRAWAGCAMSLEYRTIIPVPPFSARKAGRLDSCTFRAPLI